MNTSQAKASAASITLAILLVFGLTFPTLGDDISTESESARRTQAKTVFELYCGNCSRSMQYNSSYASVTQAMHAAGEASEKWTRTEIKSSDLPDGVRTKYSPSLRYEYRVYARGCKASWSLHSSHASYTDAIDVTKKLNDAKPGSGKLIWHHTWQQDATSKKPL